MIKISCPINISFHSTSKHYENFYQDHNKISARNVKIFDLIFKYIIILG